MAMARKKPRLATVPEVRYSAGEDAVDFMQISQEPDTPEMAARRHGSILSQNNLNISPTIVLLRTTKYSIHFTSIYINQLALFVFLLPNLKIPKVLGKY